MTKLVKSFEKRLIPNFI